MNIFYGDNLSGNPIYISHELNKELNKLRSKASIKKGRRGSKKLFFSDIIWFLVDHYKKCEFAKKIEKDKHVFVESSDYYRIKTKK